MKKGEAPGLLRTSFKNAAQQKKNDAQEIPKCCATKKKCCAGNFKTVRSKKKLVRSKFQRDQREGSKGIFLKIQLLSFAFKF
jgi:hypothetical protein